MPGEINIPIKVTGAEQAKADVRAVAAEIARAPEQAAGAREASGAANDRAWFNRARDPGGGGSRATDDVAWRARVARARDEASFRTWRQQEDEAAFRTWRLQETGQLHGAQLAEAKDLADGLAQVGAAAKDAAGQTNAFHVAGERAAINILGRINPALGEMGHMLSAGLRTIGAMSASLLGMIAAAAGLGLVVNWFERLAEEARKSREEIARNAEEIGRLRASGAKERASLAEEAAKAGLYTDTPALQTRSRGLQEGGLSRRLADSAALAEALAAGRGMPFDVEQYLRGLTTRGMQPPELAGIKGLQELRRILRAGQRPGTDEALRIFREGIGTAAREEAPSPRAEEGDPLQAAIKAARDKYPMLTESEALAAAQLARARVTTAGQAVGVETGAGPVVAPDSWHWINRPWYTWGDSGTEQFQRERPAGLGGQATIGQLVEIARQLSAGQLGGQREAERLISGQQGGVPAAGQTEGQRAPTVIINITNHNTSVDTGHFEPPGARYRNEGIAAAELLTGVE